MKAFFLKIFTKNTLAALVLGGVFFGFFKYTEYQSLITSNELGEVETGLALSQQRILSLKNQLSATKNENTDLVKHLSEEQEKSTSLSHKITNISKTVGVLEKLSTTDPELLKKYSKTYFLNEHYVPISLTDIELKYVSNGDNRVLQIHSDVWDYLRDLLDAAEEDNLSLRVTSAYRSFGEQAVLKSTYKFNYGAGTANQFSAEQGYSEHQLGTAVDFTTPSIGGGLAGFDKTPEYKWLLENAYQYGFILSYPLNNGYYKFEPWHWRFVGVQLAIKLHKDNAYFYNTDQRIIDTYLDNIFD